MSIASRIENMTTNIENAYNSIEDLGIDLTNINKNIENISTKIDEIYNNYPKITGEGTSINLDNTKKARLTSTLKGNTSQDGKPTPDNPINVNVVSGDNEIIVTGYNLLDFSSYSQESKVTVNSDGSVTLNGAGGFSLNFKEIEVKQGITYSTFVELVSGTITGNPVNGIGLMSPLGKGNYLSNNTQDIYTPNSNANKHSIWVGDQGTYNNARFRIWAYVGSTPLPYEPYQGNTYNIDLPVENLVDTPATNNDITGSGLTYTRSDDGSIQITGTTNRAWDYTLTTSYTFEAGRTYTFSADGISGEVLYIIFNSNNGGLFSINSSNPSRSITIVETQTLPVKWSKASGLSVDLDLKIMIEKGSKSNSYTPYGTTPIELCKIGDYQDYFYKENDIWYLHKEIGKVVFNGSENWTLASSDTNTTRFYRPISDIINGTTDSTLSKLFSDYFKPTTFGLIYNGDEPSISQYGGNQDALRKNIYIRIDNTLATTVSGFKTWLSSNNASLYYILSTATTTEITDATLISQLEALRNATSYDNQTNISQTNDDLPFIISASALKGE